MGPGEVSACVTILSEGPAHPTLYVLLPDDVEPQGTLTQGQLSPFHNR